MELIRGCYGRMWPARCLLGLPVAEMEPLRPATVAMADVGPQPPRGGPMCIDDSIAKIAALPDLLDAKPAVWRRARLLKYINGC